MKQEIVNGEEQRAYIDMLKNQVEKKLIEMGYANPSQKHLKAVDTLIDVVEAQRLSRQSEHECTLLKEELSSLHQAKEQALQEQHSEFQQHIATLTCQFEQLESENSKLLQEKQTLSEYVMKHTAEQKQMVQASESSRSLLSQTQDEVQRLSKHAAELESKIKEKDALLKEVKGNLDRLREDYDRKTLVIEQLQQSSQKSSEKKLQESQDSRRDLVKTLKDS